MRLKLISREVDHFDGYTIRYEVEGGGGFFSISELVKNHGKIAVQAVNDFDKLKNVRREPVCITKQGNKKYFFFFFSFLFAFFSPVFRV
jgi:hypothetical protein